MRMRGVTNSLTHSLIHSLSLTEESFECRRVCGRVVMAVMQFFSLSWNRKEDLGLDLWPACQGPAEEGLGRTGFIIIN